MPANASGARMELLVLHAQVIPVQMRIDSRRLDRAVAQELLDHAKIASSFQEMRRAGVAKRVGGDRPREPCCLSIPLQELPVPHARESPAQPRQEERALAAIPEEVRAGALEVARQ